MGLNQHRWKASLVDEHASKALDGVADWLNWAWKEDMKSPKSYPLNTDYAFSEIRSRVKQRALGKVKRIRTLPAPPPPPKQLSELVFEGTIKSIYEEQNDGTYQDALKQASLGTTHAYRVWRKIWRAMDAAYQVNYFGVELAPVPRVHFLHRNLLEIARLVGLADLTHNGVVEFLDDVCPCGRSHKSEAVRKLRNRWTHRKTK
jgi:hypothetical protein